MPVLTLQTLSHACSDSVNIEPTPVLTLRILSHAWPDSVNIEPMPNLFLLSQTEKFQNKTYK
jgi:hypothetical protein